MALLSWPDDFGSLTAQRRNAEVTSVSLHGRVLDESGQPLPDLIQVDLVCSGRIRQQTLTSPDGTFSFDMDQSRSEDWIDPGAGGSVSGAIEGSARVAPAGRSPRLDEVPSAGRGRVNLSGCEIRVAPQAGFSSNSIGLRTRSSFDNPDVGVLILRRLSNRGATTVSLSTLKAPGKAREAFERAQQELTASKPDFGRVIRELEKAVEEYPHFSAAWDLLARVHLSRGDEEKGRDCFLRATQEEPGFIQPYLGLAQLGLKESRWTDVITWTGKVLELDSQYPQALYWNGLANYYLNRWEEAGETLSDLYGDGHAETYPFGLLLLGVIHANHGRIQEAATELHLYLRLMPPDEIPEGQREELEKQLATWESEGLATLPQEAGSQPPAP